MARSSQYRLGMLGSISVLATGCIVPDAPEYGVPIVSDVVVDQNTVFPDTRGILVVDNVAGQSLHFTFDTHSEDADQHIVSAFYVDYKHDDAELVLPEFLPPLTFDVARKIDWNFTFPSKKFPDTPGCHILTAIVLHEKGWNFQTNEQIDTPPDLAAVSWVVDFNDDTNTVPLSSCPQVSTIASATGNE